MYHNPMDSHARRAVIGGSGSGSGSSNRRRAALASLDINAVPVSPRPDRDEGNTEASGDDGAPRRGDKENLAGGAARTKRPAEAELSDSSPSAKQACLMRSKAPAEEPVRQRSQSHSPAASSIFDTSVADASWAMTTATAPDEHDVTMSRPVRMTQRMTREQTREKVEILRLRLSLATYKLRTGQTTMPLAELQPRLLPPRPDVCEQSTTRARPQSEPERATTRPADKRRTDDDVQERERVGNAVTDAEDHGADDERTRGRRRTRADAMDDEGAVPESGPSLTTGALGNKGRAASGLLHLARSSHALR